MASNSIEATENVQKKRIKSALFDGIVEYLNFTTDTEKRDARPLLEMVVQIVDHVLPPGDHDDDTDSAGEQADDEEELNISKELLKDTGGSDNESVASVRLIKSEATIISSDDEISPVSHKEKNAFLAITEDINAMKALQVNEEIEKKEMEKKEMEKKEMEKKEMEKKEMEAKAKEMKKKFKAVKTGKAEEDALTLMEALIEEQRLAGVKSKKKKAENASTPTPASRRKALPPAAVVETPSSDSKKRKTRTPSGDNALESASKILRTGTNTFRRN